MMKKDFRMRLKKIYAFGLSLVLIFSSCSTYKYDKVYSPTSYSVLIDGYWGKWESLYERFSYTDKLLYKVETRYNANVLEILIYGKIHHPSNFKAKIIIDKTTGKQQDKEWTSYQGTITTKEIPLSLATDLYAMFGGGKLVPYQTFKCQINCDTHMQKAIQKNGLLGTINLYYGDGKGDAITFQ